MANPKMCDLCGERHWSYDQCPARWYWQVLYNVTEANFADLTGERLAEDLDADGFSIVRARSSNEAATKAAKLYSEHVANNRLGDVWLAVSTDDPATNLMSRATVEVFRVRVEAVVTATVEDASGRMVVEFKEQESEAER